MPLPSLNTTTRYVQTHFRLVVSNPASGYVRQCQRAPTRLQRRGVLPVAVENPELVAMFQCRLVQGCTEWALHNPNERRDRTES
jgi:hypothetical protein